MLVGTRGLETAGDPVFRIAGPVAAVAIHIIVAGHVRAEVIGVCHAVTVTVLVLDHRAAVQAIVRAGVVIHFVAIVALLALVDDSIAAAG
jgi:hypothetical protein